jgi:polyphosphate kinase
MSISKTVPIVSKTPRFVNREISWLDFNARVLQEAQDDRVPLIERLRFIGIFSNNLDEFYKVRYATVKRIALSEKSGRKAFGGQTAQNLLTEITQKTIALQKESLLTLDSIEALLKEEKVFFINEKQITQTQADFLHDYFIQTISPALSTIVLDDSNQFPHLKDRLAFLAIRMEIAHEKQQTQQYALIEIPETISRFVVLPSEDDTQQVMLIDDVIRFHLDTIFRIFNYQHIEAHMIKITRDAELDIDDDLSKSYVEKIAESVKDRLEGDPVRFVYDQEINKETLSFLLAKMGINHNTDSLIPGGRYHNRRDYMNFPSLGRKNLLYSKIDPLTVEGLSLESRMFDRIQQRDFLQYTPYHTFSYVVRFLQEAALDPNVKNIFITIYRLSKISNVANALINAAKSGKKVTVQIELQARFDERANIRYAEQMKAEGVHLIFGIQGLKVHSKVCVVERVENKKLKRYGFISTGNFNESTAKIYTDYTLFTSNQLILKEVSKVFQFFITPYKNFKYKHLIVSPHSTEKEFKKLIHQEMVNAKSGKSASIRIKLNNLTSYRMVEALYAASQAGVKIQMIVRGVCCLIPGVKGMSENIEVISVVDKFLEHTRLLVFENDGDSKVFISSADWMTRNIENRVEVSCPIYDEKIKKELIDTFAICWSDTVKARCINTGPNNPYRTDQQSMVRSQFATYDYYQKKLLNSNSIAP